MKTISKLLWITLAVCMLLTLCACGNGEPAQTTAPETTLPVETTRPTEQASGYTVKVVDENGNPIVGAAVQLCSDTCYPNATDANGEAFFQLAEAEYKVSFLFLPVGYTYSTDAQEFYFESGATELTVVLKAEG